MPQGILLDIEGTTSSISFVHDVMFPFVLDNLEDFLDSHFNRSDVQQACETIAADAGFASLAEWSAQTDATSPRELIEKQVRELMANDVKATGLKQLQGIVWELGFRSGILQAHVYPDVIPAIERWRAKGIDVRIYSSGSVAAQKLFFGHLEGEGDRLDLLSGYYDTTIGGKKEAESYQRIARDWKLPPAQILFISDIFAELEAAQVAGLETAASLRPGNQPLPESYSGRKITSLAEIE